VTGTRLDALTGRRNHPAPTPVVPTLPEPAGIRHTMAGCPATVSRGDSAHDPCICIRTHK
jgi:hypothetical protein